MGMAKTFLVTGGTGFLGSALVRRLVAANHRVRVLDNESRGSCRRLADLLDDLEFIQADIRDAGAVAEAAKGVDCVWHLAFVNGTEFFYRRPELVLDVGVKGIVNVLDACLAHDVPELMLASSSEVYQSPPAIPTDEAVPLSVPDPLNPRYSYAGGKIIGELMALNYGRKRFERVVVFRPHNVYGPDMGGEHVVPQFVLRMKRLSTASTGAVRFPIQGEGEQTRAFVFVDDFIDGLMLLADRGEHLGIYHVGTMEEISIRSVAEEVGRYFGREVVIEPGPSAAGGTPRRCPDIAKMLKLGYSPKIRFRQGLQVAARWYDENSTMYPAG